MAKKTSKPSGPGTGKSTGASGTKAPAKPAAKGKTPVKAAPPKPVAAKSAPVKTVTAKAPPKQAPKPVPGKPAPAAKPTPPAKPAPAAKSAPAKAPAPVPAKAPAGKAPAHAKPASAGKQPAPGKPAPAKPEAPKGKAGAKAQAPAADAKGDPKADAKNGRKGITIVQPKPVKKAKPKPKAPMSGAHAIPSMLSNRPGSQKPLIPSGPAASPSAPLGFHGHPSDGPRTDVKSPFGKKELAHFRQILLQKRAELVGDVSSMESEALKSESGSLSSVPQHMAEQGSENYDQSLSLDLAAADRKLIREIDDALVRIEKGTYGICELTGKPIRLERLEELPWARHSIEAARDLERRHMRL